MSCKKLLTDPLKKELLKIATEFEKDAKVRAFGYNDQEIHLSLSVLLILRSIR